MFVTAWSLQKVYLRYQNPKNHYIYSANSYKTLIKIIQYVDSNIKKLF